MNDFEIIASIYGVQCEIEKRQHILAGLKYWYNNPEKTTMDIKFSYFYSHGIKTMRELKRLIAIREDLKTLIRK